MRVAVAHGTAIGTASSAYIGSPLSGARRTYIALRAPHLATIATLIQPPSEGIPHAPMRNARMH